MGESVQGQGRRMVNGTTTELVKASAGSVVATDDKAILPELMERAGQAARCAWEEFFFAEHHNLYTQRAYESAERRFSSWRRGKR